jgi:hypothetical protein
MNNSLKYTFLALAIIGIVVPYMAFIPFVAEHGLDVPLLIEQAGANRIAAFAWLDVIVSAVVLLIAAYSRQFVTLKQAGIVTVLTLAAGVSAGLPMMFYFMVAKQENNKEKE